MYMYTIYINNTLPPALAVHEIYRDIFGPPMVLSVQKLGGLVEITSYTTVKGTTFFKLPSNNDSRSMKIQENPVFYG